MSSQRPQQGFTLLEVLIALVISALIAVMAFQSLNAANNGAERTNQVLNEINQIDRAWQIIAADLRHSIPLPATADRNWVFRAESLRTSGENSDQEVLLFKRRGWVNFSNLPRSDLQIVSYRVLDGELWRDFLPEHNRDLGDVDLEEDGFHQLLLKNVKDVQLRMLHQGAITSKGKSALEDREYSNDWLQSWPDNNQQGANGLPLAVEISIELEGVGTSVRLFALPEQPQ
ncbi:type II secretion system minor pseudopilin GspJ [Cellvibrio sp. pealriver]|uniref:type II secretion system minor pseudopilin GspJ n=1 Tax=Cellvibrio sp. pealriver TaxID=1622269 RepID=UPI00066FC4D9|nr:type II secretion system minor pseudopilin GspJ [Cellvibrio sp. pealriver]